MPIYEYRCECGAMLETIERIGTQRTYCDELCTQSPPRRNGKVERLISSSQVRGTGHEATEPTVDPHQRAGRPWDDCA